MIILAYLGVFLFLLLEGAVASPLLGCNAGMNLPHTMEYINRVGALWHADRVLAGERTVDRAASLAVER